MSLMRPHGGWSQEALVALLPPDRYTAEWAEVPGSEGSWDTSASSSLAYGATAGHYARLAEVSAWQRLKNGEGRKGTLAVPAISVWGGAAETRTVMCSGKSSNHRG